MNKTKWFGNEFLSRFYERAIHSKYGRMKAAGSGVPSRPLWVDRLNNELNSWKTDLEDREKKHDVLRTDHNGLNKQHKKLRLDHDQVAGNVKSIKTNIKQIKKGKNRYCILPNKYPRFF